MTITSLLQAQRYSKDWKDLPIRRPLEVGLDDHFGVPQNRNDSSRASIERHDLLGRKPGEDYRIVRGPQFSEEIAEPRVEDKVDSTLTKKAVADRQGRPTIHWPT